MRRSGPPRTALVHLASGVGNIVMATPMLIALNEAGVEVDVRLHADYEQTRDLFADWAVVRAVVETADVDLYAAVVPAIPPFYWRRFAALYRRVPHAVRRPLDHQFYADEQAYYFAFARALGCGGDRPAYSLPIAPVERFDVTASTVVLAPGCKTGEMTAKRWPHFPSLADRFDDVVVVGLDDDLRRADGSRMEFSGHVRMLTGRLTLRETAEVLASAGVVVANDSGLGHVAGAVGTPAILLFGPTPHEALGWFPSNVTVVRAGLGCEPCWRTAKLRACARRVDCLAALTVDRVAAAVRGAFDGARVNGGEEDTCLNCH